MILRRALIYPFALCLGLALTGCDPGPKEGEETPPQTTDVEETTAPPEQAFVRPNVGTLAPDGPEFAAIRKGVEVMKSRPASDPTSWLYQANIHGTYDTPALEAWNTCQHGSYFFLSWHRMYLYYFERILRDASGDPKLALPFWDYTEPSQRAIPQPFRDPEGPQNPLFVLERNPGINAGAQLPESATRFEVAMGFVNFDSPTGSGLSFGGQRVPGPVHFSSPHGQLESQPHDIIHVLVGGNNGWMSDPNLAARDPIFWFHHANIDRLWNVWKSRGGGRVDPSDNLWRTQIFTFFDVGGTKVTMTGQQVVDTAAQLDYTYAAGSGDGGGVAAAESLPAAPFTDDKREVVVEKRAAARLRGAQVRVALALPAEELQPGVAGAEEGRLTLVLEGIKFGRPGVYYEVYAGLPQGTQPDPESPHYVGNLAFFGQLENGQSAHQHAGAGHANEAEVSLAYDLERVVEQLRGQPNFKGDLSLQFVPRGLTAPEGQAGVQSAPPAHEVRVERVRIVRE